MKKYISIFFCMLLAIGAGSILFFLFSGRTELRATHILWEEDLRKNSPLSVAVRKGLEHTGNFSGEVVTGRDGVLFWRPELQVITEPSHLTENISAIEAISRKLRGKNGILIIPVPLRAWFLREFLPLPLWLELPHTADGRKLAELLPAGNVLPLEEIFTEMYSAGRQVYLFRDNHWTPEAMKNAVMAAGNTLGLQSRRGELEKVKISGNGNLGRLTGAEPEEIEALKPLAAGETIAEDMPEILLCGDSFFNIYSLATSGFGTGAGFPDLLEELFYCRVVSVCVDGGGEFGTRCLLPELAIRPEDFDFVIWEFPVYELQRSNWEIVPAAKKKEYDPVNTAGGKSMIFTVKSCAGLPQKNSVNALYNNVMTEAVVSAEDGMEYLLCLPILLEGREMPLPAAGDRISVKVLMPEESRIYSTMARESVVEEDFSLRPLIYGESFQILHTAPRQ